MTKTYNEENLGELPSSTTPTENTLVQYLDHKFSSELVQFLSTSADNLGIGRNTYRYHLFTMGAQKGDSNTLRCLLLEKKKKKKEVVICG